MCMLATTVQLTSIILVVVVSYLTSKILHLRIYNTTMF
jgi:hypothetical protein